MPHRLPRAPQKLRSTEAPRKVFYVLSRLCSPGYCPLDLLWAAGNEGGFLGLSLLILRTAALGTGPRQQAHFISTNCAVQSPCMPLRLPDKRLSYCFRLIRGRPGWRGHFYQHTEGGKRLSEERETLTLTHTPW